MINIVLCGGSGTRLWPISRKLMPKQFVPLFENRSLYQLTLERNRNICDATIIVSNEDQYFLASDQKDELKVPNTQFLLEPFGKNTAPAIALACLQLKKDDIILVTPSDHIVKKNTAYAEAINRAGELAREGALVTFGIKPETPETGFGYIHADGENVLSFKEKPDLDTAKKYLEQGNYYWNSGMFCFLASSYLKELKKQNPEMHDACEQAVKSGVVTENTLRITAEAMEKIPDDSIDYAVMEKCKNVKVVPSDVGWSDVGSFDSLYYELPNDEDGNTICHNHINIDSSNNMIVGNERLIATIDVHDLHIIDTTDALLIARRGSGQRVKEIVGKLKESGSDLPDLHVTAHRPWGTYTILEEGPGYKIKTIVVKPRKRLSLQKHFHRNEHWVVVSGTALVTVGEDEKIVRQNESIYISMGTKHRLDNPGKVDLVLIEAQVGEYLGEDDIVRLEDDFNRS
ncbi:MAG: mannose-1-phosphate guanylyltransferase/mannose-6-phosphate isomerase [Leptospirales bacterium]